MSNLKPATKVVFNFTQHDLTQDQIKDLENQDIIFVHMREDDINRVKELITFDALPTQEELYERANSLILLANGYRNSNSIPYAVIGGAPFFQSTLENVLQVSGWVPLHAFSKRVVEEIVTPEGETIKKSIFKHEGFFVVE